MLLRSRLALRDRPVGHTYKRSPERITRSEIERGPGLLRPIACMPTGLIIDRYDSISAHSFYFLSICYIYHIAEYPHA